MRLYGIFRPGSLIVECFKLQCSCIKEAHHLPYVMDSARIRSKASDLGNKLVLGNRPKLIVLPIIVLECQAEAES